MNRNNKKTGEQEKINFYVIPLKESLNPSPDLNKVGPMSEQEFHKAYKTNINFKNVR